MLRRFTSIAVVVLMLLATTRLSDRIGPGYDQVTFFGFFIFQFALFLAGIAGTERGYFGPRSHPVNRLFVVFGWVGILGATVVMGIQGFNDGDPRWLNVVCRATMFTGGMACVVLAVSSSPWKDLLFSRRSGAGSDPVTSGDQSVHGVPG